MTLYEADLDKIAVPVVKEKRKLKTKDTEKDTKEPKVKKPRAVKDDAEPKKKRAPKKKVEEVVVPTEEVKVEEVKVEEPAKVEPVVEEEKKIEAAVSEALDAPIVEKKKRAPRAKKDPSVPPQWFAKYVEGVKSEQASLKPEKIGKKQIKEEAKEEAAKSWNNGLTRNRVQNEVDGHSTILLT